MAFHDVRLPAWLAFGSTGGVERRTQVTMLGSGYERRTTPWAEGRRRYLIGAGLRSLDDMAALTSFLKRDADGCMVSGFATSRTSGAGRRARP